MEVAKKERNGRIAVLKEPYIEGDSLAELLRGVCFTARRRRGEITLAACQALWVLRSMGSCTRCEAGDCVLRGRRELC